MNTAVSIKINDSVFQEIYTLPGDEKKFYEEHKEYFPEAGTPVLVYYPLDKEYAFLIFGAEEAYQYKLDEPHRYAVWINEWKK